MPNTISHIKVIDSPTGSGKTTFIKNYINKSSDDEKFFVITPYLDEVDGFIRDCPSKHFRQPDQGVGRGSKMRHLIKLISEGCNICSTHALLQNINDELMTALRNNNYTLVLDESFQVIEKYNFYSKEDAPSEEEQENLTKGDVNWLLENNYIQVDENYLVVWTDDERAIGNKYLFLKSIIKRNMLYMVRNKLFVWTFPYELFSDGIFKECYILTYLFTSQFQHYYYNYFGLKYETFHIEKNDGQYGLIKTINNDFEIDFKKNARKLITILENDQLNRIGDVVRDVYGREKSTALSMTWYRNNPMMMGKISSNLSNYFRHITKSSPSKRMWTCFKDFMKDVKNPLATKKSFLSFSTRAMNKYGNRTVLAFMINRYPNQFYVDFFKQKGIIVDSDLYALSDMIQWIWRSAIRNGKPITLYIPSQRMRNILKDFLDNKPIGRYSGADYEYE